MNTVVQKLNAKHFFQIKTLYRMFFTESKLVSQVISRCDFISMMFLLCCTDCECETYGSYNTSWASSNQIKTHGEMRMQSNQIKTHGQCECECETYGQRKQNKFTVNFWNYFQKCSVNFWNYFQKVSEITVNFWKFTVKLISENLLQISENLL